MMILLLALQFSILSTYDSIAGIVERGTIIYIIIIVLLAMQRVVKSTYYSIAGIAERSTIYIMKVLLAL